MGYRQIAFVSWPGGERQSVGWIRLSPEALSERSGVAFTGGVDDLGPFMEAALQLRSGRGVFLLHRVVPDYGIDVYADSLERPPVVMKALSSALRLAAPETVIFDRRGGTPSGGARHAGKRTAGILLNLSASDDEALGTKAGSGFDRSGSSANGKRSQISLCPDT